MVHQKLLLAAANAKGIPAMLNSVNSVSAGTYGYYIKRVSGILFKSSLVCQGIRMVYGCLEGGRAQATA